MRTLILAAAAMLAATGVANAQPAGGPAPPPAPPRVFLAAGYSQPDITPGFCKNIDASRTQCTLPAMTAGRYLIAVAGTSTATAADAAQQIVILVGDPAVDPTGVQSCTSTRRPDPNAPWAVGAKRTFTSACVVTVITDTPLPITAIYADSKATKDPKGPLLSVSRRPWGGALEASALNVQQQQQQPAQ